MPRQSWCLIAFVLSALLSGLAGSLKALVLGFETLNNVHWSTSGLVILMTLAGGVGTFIGPVLGAIVIIGLEEKLGVIGDGLANNTHIEWFRTIGDSVSIVIGLIFITCVLTFRSGIAGEAIAFFERWRRPENRNVQEGRFKRVRKPNLNWNGDSEPRALHDCRGHCRVLLRSETPVATWLE